MTIIQTRASAASVTTLRKRVRRLVGDKETVSARQRWSDAEIDQALLDEMFKLYSELSEDSGSYLISSNLTYTGGSESIALPAAAQAVPIYKIEDITNSNQPRLMSMVPFDQIEQYTNHDLNSYVWSRADTTISVRPKPTPTLTLRIFYIGNPFSPYSYDVSGNVTTSLSTDQHPYPVAHEELICLGAAIRLQEEDDEIPVTRPKRYDELYLIFQKQAYLYKGRRVVRSVRTLE